MIKIEILAFRIHAKTKKVLQKIEVTREEDVVKFSLYVVNEEQHEK